MHSAPSRRPRKLTIAFVAGALLCLAGPVAPSLAQSDVDLLSDANIRLDGAAAHDSAGGSVSDTRDVNGDRRPDLIVGAPGAGDRSGSAYVVFGKSSTATVDLAALGIPGFRIDGAAEGLRCVRQELERHGRPGRAR